MKNQERIDLMNYEINREFLLGPNEGDSRKAQNLYIIVHDTANPKATGRNEATYMKRNWQNAYTTHIVGDGKVYLVGEPGYISYGALNANPYAPAQIELQATPDINMFKKNYPIYIQLIRDLAKQFGLPLTLDAGGQGTAGVKSHLWVTNNYGGDHTDPYGYLASMGISKAQFAKDIATGIFSGNQAATGQSKPQSKPTDPTVANPPYSTLSDGKGNYAHVDRFGPKGDKLWVNGWHVAPYTHEFLIFLDRRTGKEIPNTRRKAKGQHRPDVNIAYKTSGNVGFDEYIDLKLFKGRSVVVLMRATNDPKGDTKGGHQDFTETRWYHDL